MWPAALASVVIHVLALGGFVSLGGAEAKPEPRATEELHPVEMVEIEVAPREAHTEPEPPPPPRVELDPISPPPRAKPQPTAEPIEPRPVVQSDAEPPASEAPAPSAGGPALPEGGAAGAAVAVPTTAPGSAGPGHGPGTNKDGPEIERPPGPRGMSRDELRAYATGCRGRFMRQRRYPPAALRLRLEGTVKVKVEIDRRGQIVGKPTIAKSSSHQVLDNEALRAVEASAPFPPLPSHAKKASIVLVIPIDFKLQR